MRKSLVLITTVFAMFLLLPLASCQHSSDSNTSSSNTNTYVVFIWISESGATFTFNNDGTYSYKKDGTESFGTYETDKDGNLILTREDGSGFYFEITDDTATVYETENGKKKDNDTGTSFKKENSSETGEEQTQNWIIFYTLTEAAEYISNLTESGTYYIKIIDENTSGLICTTCGLKDALKKLDNKDISIYLDISEVNIKLYYQDFRVGKALVGIILPSDHEYVASQLFYECTKLEYVVLPESILRIDDGAFWGCSSLKTITIPKSVTKIVYYAFRDCSSLTTINIEHEDGKVWGHHKRPGENGNSDLSPTKDDIIVFDCFLDNIIYLLTNNGTLKCKSSCSCSDDCDCTSLNSDYTTMSYYYCWYKVDS